MVVHYVAFLILLFFSNLSFSDIHRVAVCRHGNPKKIYQKKPPAPVILQCLKTSDPYSPPRIRALPLSNFKVDLKILLLTATGSPLVEPSFLQAKKSLQSLGIPFDILVLTKNGVRVSNDLLKLTNPDGSGKYYGIVTTTGELSFQVSSSHYQSALTTEQWDQLKTYEAKYLVRRVSMYSFPTEAIGVSFTDGNTSNNYLTLTAAATPYASGIPLTAHLPLEKTWIYYAKIKNEKLAKVFLNYKNSSIAGATVKFEDGREQLHFFFSQSADTLGSVVIAPIWIKWLTRNAYIGKRRIFLNPQVDDIFLATNIWDIASNTTPVDAAHTYRITTDDLINFISYQNIILKPFIQNLNFKTELAYNGYGVKDNGDYLGDPLFKKFKEFAKEFSWLSHTWSHADLTNTTYQETMGEITMNYQTAQMLSVWGTIFYSQNAMVTPKITGLFNGDALHALADQRILYVAGDDSLPELTNQENSHLGLYATHGVYIIPRHATEIFYNTSLPEEVTSEYNFLYKEYFGKNSTFTEILEREEGRALKALLNFDYAPWMFHQANLRKFKYKKINESLLSLWLKQITTGLKKYSDLPILNIKMNDLKNLYLVREDFEKCNFKGQLVITNFNMTKINASSKRPCSVTLSGIKGTGFGVTQEVYGPDFNLNFSMDGKNTKGIVLSTPIPMN